jgi:hypothetical protein
MELFEDGETSPNISDNKDFTAKLSKENFKSLFYMFSGKPDSITQPLPRDIILTIEDIKQLNHKIQEKLTHFVTQAVITTVDITHDKGMSKEFGVWTEFLAHDWKVPLVTQTITLKWDFLIQLPSYKIPQRHTISVKIQEPPKELEAIQLLFSTLENGEVGAEIGVVPTIVRVDFINHLLSQELVNIVTEWNESLPIPRVQETFFTKIKKNKRGIARITHYSLPIFTTILSGAILRNRIASFGASKALTLAHFEFAMIWFLATGTSIFLANFFGKELAGRAYKTARKYGEYRTFLITSGDNNKQSELENKNRSLILSFSMTTLFSLTLNIIAGLFTWWLTKPNAT